MFRRYISKFLILIFILPIQIFAQNQTISYQDGVNGYYGTIDTYIDNSNPDSSFSNSTGLSWDGSPDELTTFIRFENIFVSQGGQIPDDSYIVSANLSYYVYNGGNDAAVSEILNYWDNSLTWHQFDFNNDIGTFVGTAESETKDNYESIDVTNSIASWSSNPSLNYGWIFQFTGSGGSDIYSSERTTTIQRPLLTVVYSNNFPPNQPTLISPSNNSNGIILSPSLVMNVSDHEDENLNIRYFARAVSSSVNFTLIGVPDTQYYTDNVDNNQYFYDQTNWIVANKDALNIAFISQVGDCVESGDTFDSEWQVVNTAWTTVENPLSTGLVDGLPYGLNVGNHDQSPAGGGSMASTVKYNQYFGISRFQNRAYYGGHYGSDNDNHYEMFHASGMDFIVINLEYDPIQDQDVLNWADTILKTYSNRRAIVVSHYIIDGDDEPIPNAFGPQGQSIYDDLKDNPNLFLMLCGHRSIEGRRSDNFNGSIVQTLLANFQTYPNGGNGFLRIMEFRPAENKIHVSTYSPSLNQFETDSNSEFVIDYDMGSESYQEIGNINNITSGSNVSFPWSSLSPSTEYEWYVEVFDGNNTTISPTWSFTTEEEDVSLPVFISSFSATRTEKKIYLEWIAEAEFENAGFIVEKSLGSENSQFFEIASYQNLDDLKGLGNASDMKIYNLTDTDISNGQTYNYRLADVSIHGQLTYHETININPEFAAPEINLNQNYPNPFNSFTTIAFDLPKATFVEINVYDIQGRNIETLEKTHKNAGRHHLIFNASKLASGIYYYELKTSDFKSVKKFILTK